MEKFFLENPTITRKQEALDYLSEFVKYGFQSNGMGGLDRCIDEITYEEWLLELRKNIAYSNQIDRVCSKTFFVIRENDHRIVGMVNVRYQISNDKLKNWASHIGYGIRPTERRKGYAKIALYLGLLEEQKKKEEKNLLICDVDNIASNKTIVSLGGIYEKTSQYPYDNTMVNYYWIDVNASIKKYYKQYKNRIKVTK